MRSSGLSPDQRSRGSRARLWPLALAVVLGLALGAAGGYFIWGRGGGSDPFATPTSTEPPVEYLYLDSPRIATYLCQIEDGLKSNEVVTLSHTKTAGASASGADLGLQGTIQSHRSLQETVTPTAASLFYRLEARLRDHQWLRTLNATLANFDEYATALASLDEGSFVSLLGLDCRMSIEISL
jgi:hypothetical protein